MILSYLGCEKFLEKDRCHHYGGVTYSQKKMQMNTLKINEFFLDQQKTEVTEQIVTSNLEREDKYTKNQLRSA